MTKTTPEQNKAIVLEGFETLFNKRDYAAAIFGICGQPHRPPKCSSIVRN